MIWLVILGAPVVLAAWFAIFVRWRLGILMLLAYLPISGAITLWLSPDPAPLLFKDFLFVIPVYLSAGLVHLRDFRLARVPVLVTGLVIALALLVVVQMFNPNLSNFLAALVGAKVWLLYLPLLYIGGAALRTQDDLVPVLRVMTVTSAIPFAVGFVQFGLASTIGLERAISLFYGVEAAQKATQGFAAFDYGADLFRIPSTFTFVAQYAMYGLAMVAVAYALGRTDPSRAWRLFGQAMMIVAVAAALLSGGRGNFVFVPLLIALIYVADARLTGGLAALALFPGLILSVLWITGFDPFEVFGVTHRLFDEYGKGLVLRDLIDTLRRFPMGQGTGTSTAGARHVMNAAEASRFFAYEGYYAKTIAELGIPGLMILVSLFAVMAAYAARIVVALRGRIRSAAAAFGAFLVVVELDSFKGYHLDLDPTNVYFWLFAGILFRLPFLAREPAPQRPRAAFRVATGSIRSSGRAHRRG